MSCTELFKVRFSAWKFNPKPMGNRTDYHPTRYWVSWERLVSSNIIVSYSFHCYYKVYNVTFETLCLTMLIPAFSPAGLNEFRTNKKSTVAEITRAFYFPEEIRVIKAYSLEDRYQNNRCPEVLCVQKRLAQPKFATHNIEHSRTTESYSALWVCHEQKHRCRYLFLQMKITACSSY
jgi:hypothetical protein